MKGFLLKLKSMLTFAVLASMLVGCTQQNWQSACTILLELDATAADAAIIAEPDISARITEFRELGQPVLNAVCARAADPDAGDPTGDIIALLDGVQEWALTLDDERVRSRILLGVVGARSLLRTAAGLNLPPPPT